MKEEREKILKMLSEGLITAEEAEELLKTIQESDSIEAEELNENDFERQKRAKKVNKFKDELNEELKSVKEDLIKAKDNIVREFGKIDVDYIKEKAKYGLEKIDLALDKVDQAIESFGMKIKEKFKSEENKNNGREN